jgi:segregation and condensation protein A
VLEALDLSDLGDFLVMASTLMEIKSREMLPTESVEIEEDLDPRDDLIKRLLEYKRYRDLSRRLDRFAQRRNRMVDVTLPLPAEVKEAQKAREEEQEFLDLGEVEIWTLTAAFAKLLEETGGRNQELQIGVDKRDVRYYAARVLEKVRGKSEVTFRDLFDLDEGRYGLIGCFIAILELMKQGVMRGHQSEDHGSIVVVFRGDPTMSAEQILAGGERLDGDDGGDDGTPPRVSVPDLEGDEPGPDDFDAPPDVVDPGRN